MVELDAIASDKTNLVSGGAASAPDKADLSYSRFSAKNATADTSEATMSFSDFLDMINPLEHIPLVSSIYRAVTGESINPVSRIAGDALYGGVFGLVSAGIAALGAIGDEAVAACNDGKSASATVVAALFGDQPDSQTTQIATTDSPAMADTVSAPPHQVAGLQSPAPLQSPILMPPDLGSIEQVAETPQSRTSSSPAPPIAVPAILAGNGPGMPLDRAKAAYGGVIDNTLMQNAQQTQALALAMTGNAGILQSQHALHDNRFATAARAPSTAPIIAPQVQANPQTQNALQNLLSELQAGKALNQYKNAAQVTPLPGVSVDVTN